MVGDKSPVTLIGLYRSRNDARDSPTVKLLKELPPLLIKRKKLLVLLAGWGFIALGVVGLFLPVLQGILFLLVGLFILSSESAWAHRLLEKIRERFPATAMRFEKASVTAKTLLGTIFRRRE